LCSAVSQFTSAILQVDEYQLTIAVSMIFDYSKILCFCYKGIILCSAVLQLTSVVLLFDEYSLPITVSMIFDCSKISCFSSWQNYFCAVLGMSQLTSIVFLIGEYQLTITVSMILDCSKKYFLFIIAGLSCAVC